MSNSEREVSQEFQDIYDSLNSLTKDLAVSALNIVSENDVRKLKKVKIRIENCIEEIKSIT